MGTTPSVQAPFIRPCPGMIRSLESMYPYDPDKAKKVSRSRAL